MMMDTFDVSIAHLPGVKLQCLMIRGQVRNLWNTFFFYNFLSLQSIVVITFHFLFVIIRDFLPRGSGIVTRRPLILQLVNSNAGENPHSQIFLNSVFYNYANCLKCAANHLLDIMCSLFSTRLPLCIFCVQNMQSFCTAKERSLWTLKKYGQKLKQRLTG